MLLSRIAIKVPMTMTTTTDQGIFSQSSIFLDALTGFISFATSSLGRMLDRANQIEDSQDCLSGRQGFPHGGRRSDHGAAEGGILMKDSMVDHPACSIQHLTDRIA
jgi:hypothetical protein